MGPKLIKNSVLKAPSLERQQKCGWRRTRKWSGLQSWRSVLEGEYTGVQSAMVTSCKVFLRKNGSEDAGCMIRPPATLAELLAVADARLWQLSDRGSSCSKRLFDATGDEIFSDNYVDIEPYAVLYVSRGEDCISLTTTVNDSPLEYPGRNYLHLIQHHYLCGIWHGDAAVQQSNCEALGDLSMHSNKCRQAVVDAMGIEAIVGAMQERLSNAAMQQCGCNVLTKITRHIDGVCNSQSMAACRQPVVVAGGVAAFVAAMRTHLSDVKVQVAGGWALHNVMGASDEMCDQAILDEGGVSALASAMREHPNVLCVQQIGCHGLRSFANRARGAGGRAIVDAGGAALLAEALRCHASDRMVLTCGLAALATLAVEPGTCAQAVVEADGASIAVAAMQSLLRGQEHSDAKIQMAGLRILKGVAQTGAECRRVLMDAGGVLQLVKELERRRQRPYKLERVFGLKDICLALSYLAADEVCQQALVDAGGIKALQELLTWYEGDPHFEDVRGSWQAALETLMVYAEGKAEQAARELMAEEDSRLVVAPGNKSSKSARAKKKAKKQQARAAATETEAASRSGIAAAEQSEVVARSGAADEQVTGEELSEALAAVELRDDLEQAQEFNCPPPPPLPSPINQPAATRSQCSLPTSEAGRSVPASECVVCMDCDATHAFVPCGHQCVCQTCADRTMGREGDGKCPCCRVLAFMTIPIFKP